MSGRGLGGGVALGALCLLSSATLLALRAPPAEPHAAVPARHREGGYVGSGACQSCHPSEHQSWSKTFHRTMTRVADEASFMPELPARLELDGRAYQLARDASGRIRVQGPDLHQAASLQLSSLPDDALARALAALPRASREIVMVTGSHHYQAFWVENGRGRELRQLPFVYLLDDRRSESERWLPRRDAFLQPPDAREHIQRWNGNCVQCHSTAGRPGETSAPSGDRAPTSHFETSAAELGIACEACHGPGREHTAHYRSPIARYFDRRGATHIVNPARLDAERSSQVCGQCHSYFVPKDEEKWWQSGFSESFRAGALLDESRLVLDYARDRKDDALLSRSMDSVFWPDGTIRVGGREYNGLVKSPCFERGHGERKLACVSCHSMHQSEPADQLAEDMDTNRACTQCHDGFEQSLAAHTRHRADSSGSLCVSCHMPKTTYALLKSIRSHRITTPKAPRPHERWADDAQNDGAPQEKLSKDAPHACNLCHLDKSLSWTQKAMLDFWGTPQEKAESALAAPAAPPESPNLPASVEWLLAGNAAQRVLLADAFADPAALATSGGAWQEPLLDRSLRDPYAAVRFVAKRSLETRRAAHGSSQGARRHSPSAPTLDAAALDALTAQRNDEPITISE